MANELVARHGLRVSGNTYISSVSTDQSLLSNVLTIDPSNNEVKDLSLATFAADFITGGTLSGTGNKDLVLNQYDGSTVTISDVNIEVTGGTYTSSTGTIQFTQNDGSTFDVSLGTDFVTGVTQADNVVTITKNGGESTNFTIDAFTGATIADNDITLSGSDLEDVTLNVSAITEVAYSDWGISGSSFNVNAPSFELPFITAGTYNAGTITLSINDGVESDITITGLTTTDTHVTGGTITQSTGSIQLDFNQGYSAVTLDGVFEFVTGGTIVDNGITLETNLGNFDDLGTIVALTGLTQSGNDVSFDGSNGATGSIAIEAFTGVSISSNVITLAGSNLSDDTVTVDAITGGTFDASTGIITVEGSGNFANIDLGTDFITGFTEADNVMTVGYAGAGSTDYTIQAVTGITYNDDWDIAFVGTGSLGTSPVDLPFVTGGTYSEGTITLNLNGGAGESDITITGLTNTDTYVTGSTVDYTGATLELNQSAPDVEITSEQTLRVEKTGAGSVFSVPVASYGAVHVEYTIIDGVNARSGFFTAVFNGSNVEYSDFSTVDIGTIDAEITASNDGTNGTVSLSVNSGSPKIIANTRAVAL